MPYEKVCKIQTQQINMVEDESDGDLDYSDLMEVIEVAIAIVDIEKKMLMSDHKKDNWYVDSRASKHVTSNSIFLHDIIKTHSSLSVRSINGHAHGVEGNDHAKLKLNGSIKKITNVFYVPCMKNILISIDALTYKGNLVVFNSKRCFILNE
jgi:hypothetical protein